MTEKRKVSNDEIKETVNETLIRVGIDPSDPIRNQETFSAMRKLAEHSDDLSAVARLYNDQETKDAIRMAKGVNNAYQNTKVRVTAASITALLMFWASGLWQYVTRLVK